MGASVFFFVQNHRNGQYEKEEKQRRNKKRKEVKDEKNKKRITCVSSATTVALLMGVTVQAKGDEKVLNFGCQMYTDGCVNSANDETVDGML